MTFIEKTNQAKTKNPKIHAPFKKIITRNNEQNKIMNELKKLLGNNIKQKKNISLKMKQWINAIKKTWEFFSIENVIQKKTSSIMNEKDLIFSNLSHIFFNWTVCYDDDCMIHCSNKIKIKWYFTKFKWQAFKISIQKISQRFEKFLNSIIFWQNNWQWSMFASMYSWLSSNYFAIIKFKRNPTQKDFYCWTMFMFIESSFIFDFIITII